MFPLRLLFCFILSLSCTILKAGVPSHECRVAVDLVSVSKDKDRVRITITPPPIKDRRIRYVLPQYIPGLSGRVDAGQFVHEFYALDDRGIPLKVRKKGKNVILMRMKKGGTLRKIEYWVDDTWDDAEGKSYHNGNYTHVTNAAGTSFVAGEKFFLNTAFMFGYIDGLAWIPYRVTVHHPESLSSFSPLNRISSEPNRDEFLAESYNQMIENSIFYGKMDTVGFSAGSVYVEIAVHSETGNVQARQIRKYVNAQLMASSRFLGETEAARFKMFFYFVSPERAKQYNSGVYGNISRKNGGVYYLPEVADEEQFAGLIMRQCSGELLSRLSLLNCYITCSDGDLLRPQISPGWWLAEGGKSYFTWMAEIRDSVASEEEFMAAVSAKVRLYQNVKDVALADVGRVGKLMDDPIKAEELKAKAMLTVFLLDLELTTRTGGEKGLREFLLEINDSVYFNVDSLEVYLKKKVSSDIGVFFESYVKGRSYLPLIQGFSSIGWVYSPSVLDSMLTFGQIALYYDETRDAFFVKSADAANRFSLKAGDRLVSINGITIAGAGIEEVIAEIYRPSEPEPVQLIFIRDNQNITVQAAPYYRIVVKEHFVAPDPACSTDQLLLHNRVFFPLDY